MAACGGYNECKENERPRAVVLVMGDCGTGKSSFINALKTDNEKCEVGEDFGGVTKKVIDYWWDMDGKGKKYDIVMDVPGLGDDDIDLSKLLTLLEGAMSASAKRGAMVTTLVIVGDCNMPRSTMGHKVLMKLLKLGFMKDVKNEPEKHIIAIGTKSDVAGAKKVEVYKKNMGVNSAKKLGMKYMMVACTSAPPGRKADLSDFYKCVRKVPHGKSVKWTKIPPAAMAKAVGEVHGWDQSEVNEFKAQFEKQQKAMEKQMRAYEKKIEQLQRSKQQKKQKSGWDVLLTLGDAAIPGFALRHLF